MAHPAFDRSTYDPPPGPWPLVEVDTNEREPVPGLADLCTTLREGYETR